MTVYVDNSHIPARVNGITARWSHLIADTTPELLAFAKTIGLKPGWIQKPGTAFEHFDVTDAVRERAIKAGAQPIDIHDVGPILRAKRAAATAIHTTEPS